jgi:hypothetical protein
MRYAILCYDDEAVVSDWEPAEEAQAMQRLGVVLDRLRQAGKLGPVARLLPTSAATTVRKGARPLVLDGPFAETTEQLLGFYVVETLEEALGIAAELGAASGMQGAHEVRPLLLFDAGS